MAIHTFFPSYVYQAALQDKGATAFNKTLLKECYQVKDYDIEGQEWSKNAYIGGYTSYSSMDNLHQFSSTFHDLESAIRPHVQKYLKKLHYDISIKQLGMTDCWINIMPAAVTHSQHIHPLSLISGTYYVQTPKNSAAIKFEDPRLSRMMACPPKKNTCPNKDLNHISISPKAGDLILFESWLGHEVPASHNKKDRVSISFNYAWT
ncbi:TIGR02466 family protein [bacterium]|nr:TIGR02466 family protein [bacterium]